MKPVSPWQVVCTYITSICMLGGGLHWAFFFTISSHFISFDAYAVDELKKELDEKYQLDVPRNVDGTDLLNTILNNKQNGQPSNRDLEAEILSRPEGQGTDLDFSSYDEVDFNTEYQKFMGKGIEHGKAKVPTMTNGNMDVEYYQKAGVKFSRNENGDLVTTSIDESERGAKITSVKSSEIFTNQQTRADEEFNAPNNYGDEDAYIADLKVQYAKTSGGKTMSSEAYRAIMKGNEDNPAPKIKPDAYYFDKGNQAINDAQYGNGIWAQTCVDETITETEIKHIPIWEPRICQKPNHQNLNFCEVERVLEKDADFVNIVIHARVGNSGGDVVTAKVDFGAGTAEPVSARPDLGYPGIEFGYDIDEIDLDFFCSQNKSKVQFVSASNWKESTLNDVNDSSVDLEVVQEPSCENGMVGIFKITDRLWGKWNDEYDLTGDFVYEIKTSEYKDVYKETPKGCASRLGWKPGPYPCTGDDCYDSGIDKNNFCTFESWEIIEQGTNNYPQSIIELLHKMYPDDPNPEQIYGGTGEDGAGGHHVGTWKINAKGYSCDPLQGGEYCVDVLNPDTQKFEEKCYTYDEFKTLEGTCGPLEENPRCEKVGQSCGEGWYDKQNDICYFYTDDYKCDVSKPIEITTETTTNVCAGMLPCMGNDCAYGEEEVSEDFEKAVLLASIAQTADDDSTCVTEDPNTCEIFPGEYEYCSWELSGLGNNCCEAPSGVNFLEMVLVGYKMMQSETFKNVSSTLSGGLTDQIGGLYTDFTEMLVSGWNSGATAVVDFASSIMGDPEMMQGIAESVQMGGIGSSEALSGVMQAATQQMYQAINSMLPDVLADMIFEQAAEGAVGDLALTETANMFMSIISFVGLIYTIYNVVKILANLITQCDENEMDMGIKLAQKQCFPVGSKYCHKDVLGVCMIRRQDYCCFSSMLSRIIADQGSKQLGKDMSDCPGFTIEEFGQLDFDRIDLSEWLATMYETDILSTSGYDSQRLTGTGRMIGNSKCGDDADADCEDSVRKVAEVRASEQFKGAEASESKNKLIETFDPEQIDCSVYPRPMICEL